MAYATTNPFTGEVIQTFDDATDADINNAITRAHNTYQRWREVSFSDRAAILQRAAYILRLQKEEFAYILTMEMGKLITEARAEVELSAQIFEYYVHNAQSLLAPEILPVADPNEATAKIVHEPLGVLLAIEPWNFPYYQLARIAAPQLSAGNTILLKHASNVPQSAARFEQLLLDAGLPDGGFINLYATRSQIELILNDPRVQGVALTGSEAAGATVAQQAAKALKKSTLELGGADAFIVLSDADVKKAAHWGVRGRHWNGGQVCVNAKRMIIMDDVYDEFVKHYIEAAGQLKAGDPMDERVTLAPLCSQSAADELKAKIKLAVEHGATALEVGPKVPSHGAFVQPTILTNVTPDNPAWNLEYFGPVTMMFRAKDEDDALRIANDSPFGLGGSIFTGDTAHGEELAKRFSTGMVYINHPTRVKADLPFGGIRRSGYGRELTGLGIKEFVNHKLVSVVDIDAEF